MTPTDDAPLDRPPDNCYNQAGSIGTFKSKRYHIKGGIDVKEIEKAKAYSIRSKLRKIAQQLKEGLISNLEAALEIQKLAQSPLVLPEGVLVISLREVPAELIRKSQLLMEWEEQPLLNDTKCIVGVCSPLITSSGSEIQFKFVGGGSEFLTTDGTLSGVVGLEDTLEAALREAEEETPRSLWELIQKEGLSTLRPQSIFGELVVYPDTGDRVIPQSDIYELPLENVPNDVLQEVVGWPVKGEGHLVILPVNQIRKNIDKVFSSHRDFFR